MSPSRKARRERCTLPGAELGRARQGWQGRGRGAAHTHRRAIQAGHGCMTSTCLSVCLSHGPEKRRLLGAQRRAVPGASRPRRRTGRRERSGGACPGSIARQRLPGASPGSRSGSHMESSRREHVLVHKGAFAASSHAGALQQVTLRELGTGKGS